MVKEEKVYIYVYLAGGVETEHDVDVFGRIVPIQLDWADGMIGVIPIFSSLGAAVAYNGKGASNIRKALISVPSDQSDSWRSRGAEVFETNPEENKDDDE